MSTRRRVRIWLLPGEHSALLFLSACFVGGSLLGALLAAHLTSGGESAVSRYLTQWAQTLTQRPETVPWLADLLRHLRFPAAVALLGLVPLGVFGVPLAFGVRGMLISFTVASLLKMYAYRGMMSAFLLYGPAEVAELLLLFFLGVPALSSAGALAAGQGSPKPRHRAKERKTPVVMRLLGLTAVSLGQSVLSGWIFGAISRLLM